MHMKHGVYFTLPNCKVWLFEQYFDLYMESFQIFKEICEKEIGTADLKICVENTNGFCSYEKTAIQVLL